MNKATSFNQIAPVGKKKKNISYILYIKHLQEQQTFRRLRGCFYWIMPLRKFIIIKM